MNLDIQYCEGKGCLLRDTCRRAKDKLPESNLVWFADEPFRIVDGKFHCDLYWGLNQQIIFDELKEITNGKEDRRNDSQGTNETKGDTGSEA